jgi:hypothetical protein
MLPENYCAVSKLAKEKGLALAVSQGKFALNLVTYRRNGTARVTTVHPFGTLAQAKAYLNKLGV